MSYEFTRLPSPVGTLKLIARGSALVAVVWRDHSAGHVPEDQAVESGANPLLIETARQLGEYFAGKRREFDLPLDLMGTEFQCRVWAELRRIPYGETRSYADIARGIGQPQAVRAVGAANGRNPVSIIIPCHRVIGTSGALTGFGGGLDAKARLLALEAPQRSLLAVTS